MSSVPGFKGNTTVAEGRPEQYRCTDLWYPDGSIIFQAENVLFRVYSGLLASHSSFFSDLFSLPQPETQERYQGVPVVQIQDTANDLYYLLRAEHDTRPSDIHDEMDWDMVAAMLTLGAKYDIPHIRKMAHQMLRTIFPTTLDDWKRYYSKHPFGSLRNNHLMKLTNSAREHAQSLLPAAFLHCSEYEIQSIFYQDNSKLQFSLSELTTPNKMSLLTGYSVLRDLCRTHGFRWIQDHLSPPRDGCEQRNICRKIREYSCSTMEEHLEISEFLPGNLIMGTVQESMLKSMEKEGYCQPCKAQDIKTLADGLSYIWDHLPSMFGLGSWDKLLKLETETMDTT